MLDITKEFGHEINFDPIAHRKPKSDFEIDRECERMTIETFEKVIDAPATKEELNFKEIIYLVVYHPKASLLLKGIIHRMINFDWEGTQETINQAIHNHQEVEECQLLDIKMRPKNDF
jgi:hypothetical protein